METALHYFLDVGGCFFGSKYSKILKNKQNSAIPADRTISFVVNKRSTQ